MVVVPVPPFDIGSVPVISLARFTRPVVTAPAEALSTPVRFAIERDPKKPEVLDAYVDEKRVDDAFWNDWSAEKVFAVYVFGMVVDALIYESTDELKFDTCDEVMARFGSAVMLAIDVVPARLPMNDVVARAVVK
jgi:hypothetical protein